MVRRNPCVADDRVAEQMAEMREHGYFDVSFLTQVIDLSKGREQLWGDVRNSYRPLINRGQPRTDAQRLQRRASSGGSVRHVPEAPCRGSGPRDSAATYV